MKKKIDFGSAFWDGSTKHSCITLIEAFFNMDDLPTVKARLNETVTFSAKNEVLMNENPSLLFHYYLCMRSFIRASFVLQFKTNKFKIKDPPKYTSKLQQGSLSEEEYAHPFLVFQHAFKALTLEQFEYYHTQITYFSLSSYSDDPDANALVFFIHLNKMLDAAQIIRERGIDKIKK